MTACCLLEPYVGMTAEWEPDGVLGSAPDALWLVRLVGWQAGEWLASLPPGVVAVGEEPLVTGRLSRGALEQWIERLGLLGAGVLSAALSQTLAAHLVADPVLVWGRWQLDLSRPQVMGVLNMTPDSFSGDGLDRRVAAAVAQGVAMVAAGADILDVGGESSRPGASAVESGEELERVVPVVQALARAVDRPISVDTRKPEVMEAALAAGAAMINDVTALQGLTPQPGAWAMGAEPIVLMHMQGEPTSMQVRPVYQDVLADVYSFLEERIGWCVAHGIARSRLILDPGIGFGKSPQHNMALLRHLRVFRGLGLPVLLGVSRKRLVGLMTGETEPAHRDVGSHVLAALGVLNGARIVRVHEVAGAKQAVAVAMGWRSL